MSKAILVISFGTTFPETREKNIGAVLRRAAATGLAVYEAWTSGMILRALEKRGEHVDDVPTALARMAADGVKTIYVLPTHLLYGEEYDKLRAMVQAQASQFTQISVAPPLLACDENLRTVLAALNRGIATEPDEALVLMGHGTPHFCNTVYAAMDYHAKAMGLPHMFVGTVEAFPDLETMLAQIKAAGFRRAVLTPLMLVAGDHANNDMASDKADSWKTSFTQAGISARAVLRGLGEYEEILALYERHLQEILA